MEKLVVVAFTHRNIYLNDLGKLVVAQENLSNKLAALKADPILGIEEVFYLATCNRVEFVFSAQRHFSRIDVELLLDLFYEQFSPTQVNNLLQFASIYNGKDALEHLFKVASSLDSLVVGEREISRQIRMAYENCQQLGFTGDFLRLVMKQVVKTSKGIFTETRIAEKPISVASLAVRKLIDYQIPQDAPIFFVGAGETNALTAKYLYKAGYKNFTIFNRTLEKAEALAKEYGGRALPITELPHYHGHFDVLVTCTSSTDPLITTDVWDKLTGFEDSRRFILDLAVPNDVVDELHHHPKITYISMTSLKLEIENNMRFREKELVKAEKIIRQNLEEFVEISRIRNVELALQDFPIKVKEIKNKAMDEVFAKELSGLDIQTKLLIEKMMGYMEKKCISVPIVIAKQILLEKETSTEEKVETQA